MDIWEGAEVQHDLLVTPWPFDDNSVREVVCNHFVEHIPHDVGAGRDGWFVFFDELHRVCRKNAVCRFTHPYVKNDRAFWDPTHVRYIHEITWYYLDKQWREAQGLDHYPTKADFEVTLIEGPVRDDLMARNHEFQSYARATEWNAIGDLAVTLKVRK